MFVFKILWYLSLTLWNTHGVLGQLVIPFGGASSPKSCMDIPGFCIQRNGPTFVNGPRILRQFGVRLPNTDPLADSINLLRFSTAQVNSKSPVYVRMQGVIDSMKQELEEYREMVNLVIPSHTRRLANLSSRPTLGMIVSLGIGAKVAVLADGVYSYVASYNSSLHSISSDFKDLTVSVNENLKNVSAAIDSVEMNSHMTENKKLIRALCDTFSMFGIYKSRLTQAISGLKSLQKEEIPYDFIESREWKTLTDSVTSELKTISGVSSTLSKTWMKADFDLAWVKDDTLYIGVSFRTLVHNPTVQSYRITTIPFMFVGDSNYSHIPQIKPQLILVSGMDGTDTKFRPTQVSPILVESDRSNSLGLPEFDYPSMFHLHRSNSCRLIPMPLDCVSSYLFLYLFPECSTYFRSVLSHLSCSYPTPYPLTFIKPVSDSSWFVQGGEKSYTIAKVCKGDEEEQALQCPNGCLITVPCDCILSVNVGHYQLLRTPKFFTGECVPRAITPWRSAKHDIPIMDLRSGSVHSLAIPLDRPLVFNFSKVDLGVE